MIQAQNRLTLNARKKWAFCGLKDYDCMNQDNYWCIYGSLG